MQEFSKYRVITAGIILMFIFVIAAIYTNTKDVAMKKIQEQNTEIANNQPKIEPVTQENNLPADITTGNSGNTANEINDEMYRITERVTQLEQKVYSASNAGNEQSVRCTVQGIIDNEHLVPLTAESAVNESRTNGKEVVITCIFK